ncbi:MAG: LacI family transcriptional regulator, partial [Desulfobacterales bacterium]|nr:LacI family transcriptional regulator [Desulfobacterales bacterium]
MNDSRDKDVRVAIFPGPKRSGWAEDMYDGFMSAVSELKDETRSVTVLPPLYGDTRPEV